MSRHYRHSRETFISACGNVDKIHFFPGRALYREGMENLVNELSSRVRTNVFMAVRRDSPRGSSLILSRTWRIPRIGSTLRGSLSHFRMTDASACSVSGSGGRAVMKSRIAVSD
jgi:hypothetical protein